MPQSPIILKWVGGRGAFNQDREGGRGDCIIDDPGEEEGET